MDFLKRLIGLNPSWDGRDRRASLRVKCDFDLGILGEGLKYQGRALDASPKGVRVRIRSPWSTRTAKRGMPVKLKFQKPLPEGELDTVTGRITWVKRLSDDLFLLAIGFEDSIDNLRHSWVKPVLLRGLSAGVRQQRGYVRVGCNLPVEFLLGGKNFEGRLTDLSVLGARLEAVKAFAQGSRLDLKLPPNEGGPGLSVRAVVRRAELQQNVIFYGLTFQLDETTRKPLLQFVSSLLDAQLGAAPNPGYP